MTTEKTETKTATRPTHVIWQVIGEKEKSRWNRIGAAFPNKDGKGMLLKFDSYPCTGRIQLREIRESVEEAQEHQQ